MNPWPIAPIADTDLNFAVVSYDFASFTNNEETDLPSLEGSIDTSLLDYAGSIADQTTLIASLFDGLDDVFTVLGEIGGDDLESLFGPLTNAAASGDAILVSYQGLLGDSAGSSGGGGGVGAGGGTATCDSILTFPTLAPSALPCTHIFEYTNNLTRVNTITGVSIVDDAAGAFSTTFAAGLQVPAQSIAQLPVTAKAGLAVGTYKATIVISNDGPVSPWHYCVELTVDAAGATQCNAPTGGTPPPPGGTGGGTGGSGGSTPRA